MNYLRCFILLYIVTPVAFAQSLVTFKGTQPIHISKNKPEYVLPHLGKNSAQSLSIDKDAEKKRADKIVGILKYQFSKQAKRALQAREGAQKPLPFKYDGLPNRVQLAMNRVPVLDQGMHGTCVTFATTAALDAAMQRGNHISQLCHLTLGNYLEHYYQQPSGWEGASGETVLSQISQYGYMSLADQRQYHCGGLQEYPLYEAYEVGQETTPEEFARHSLLLTDGIYWDQLLSIESALSPEYDAEKTLSEIRAALADGHRVTIGFLLLPGMQGSGADGAYRHYADTWIMTPAIQAALDSGDVNSGHEVIVTGYDDKATVNDQAGLFTIRNSWGKGAGDHGNYYMTYAYLKNMLLESYRVYGLYDQHA